MTSHTGSITSVSFLGLGEAMHWLSLAQPWLESLSYIAAICVAVVTIYYKLKNKK